MSDQTNAVLFISIATLVRDATIFLHQTILFIYIFSEMIKPPIFKLNFTSLPPSLIQKLEAAINLFVQPEHNLVFIKHE